jgi:axial budding pattern protein 2
MSNKGGSITYNITGYPSWLKYNADDMIFTGSPSNTDVGTFTIIVLGTDSKNETASTTFTIDV